MRESGAPSGSTTAQSGIGCGVDVGVEAEMAPQIVPVEASALHLMCRGH